MRAFRAIEEQVLTDMPLLPLGDLNRWLGGLQREDHGAFSGSLIGGLPPRNIRHD